MKRNRYIYFLLGFPLLAISGFLLLMSFAILLDPRGVANPWVLVLICASLFSLSVWLLWKWYTIGKQEIQATEFVKNNTVIFNAVTTWRSGQEVHDEPSIVVLDADKQIVHITPENKQSMVVPFSELKKVRIKQFGIGVGRVFALDTTNGRIVFFLANSVKLKNDIEFDAAIATLGNAGLTSASLLITALINKDPRSVLMPETLDKLHFWFRQHIQPTNYSAKFTRSMNGVIFLTLFFPVMVILGIILERIGAQFGLSDPAMIPGLLFLSCIVFGTCYIYLIYPRRYKV